MKITLACRVQRRLGRFGLFATVCSVHRSLGLPSDDYVPWIIRADLPSVIFALVSVVCRWKAGASNAMVQVPVKYMLCSRNLHGRCTAREVTSALAHILVVPLAICSPFLYSPVCSLLHSAWDQLTSLVSPFRIGLDRPPVGLAADVWSGDASIPLANPRWIYARCRAVASASPPLQCRWALVRGERLGPTHLLGRPFRNQSGQTTCRPVPADVWSGDASIPVANPR